MTGFSSLHHNTSSLYSRMADVHLPSVNKNVKGLSNSMSTISPSLPPHDFTYILNSNPEYICQAESGAWQRFIPNLHNSFSSQFPSSLPQTGYESNDETVESAMMRELIGRLGNGEFSNGLTSLASHSTDYSCKFEEEHGWRGMDASSNISFSLELPQQNHSLPVTSLAPSARLAGTPSDPGYAESQDRFPSLCHGQHCLDSSKSAPMVTVKEHIPAFTSPSTTAQSRGKAMQSTCQREEECCEHSASSGHNAVQSPSTPVKGGISGKKRKASEDKIVDARSPVTCAVHKVVKKPKTEDMKAKQQKSSESIKQAEEVNKKAEPNSMGNSGCTSSKDPEPPKRDFIHVRARRGQATDSHSLAERVRREKISERMKFLQDLVPGCSKVSGKAVMLDEIINYVQSLQHQVESLSMKLASLNTRPNFSLDGIFGTEVLQRHITSSPFGYNHELISNLSLLNSTQAKMNELVRSRCTGGLDLRSLSTNQGITTKRSNANMSNSNIFKDANSQTSNLWEEEVQNIMQIGF